MTVELPQGVLEVVVKLGIREAFSAKDQRMNR